MKTTLKEGMIVILLLAENILENSDCIVRLNSTTSIVTGYIQYRVLVKYKE